MSTIGRVVSLTLALCTLWLGCTAEARAQGKKSDAVVKVKADAGKPNADGTCTVDVAIAIDKGWHLYANPVGQEDLLESATTLTAAGKTKAEKIDYPAGKLIKDKTVGDYKVYEDKVTIKVKVRRPDGDGPIELSLKFQACSDTKCLVPATMKLSIP